MDGVVIRKHYRFRGDVQGVGFRYCAYHAAQRLGIGGWVRNCADGSVEMEAEGSLESLCNLMDALDENRFIQIDHCDVENIVPQGSHTFFIR